MNHKKLKHVKKKSSNLCDNEYCSKNIIRQGWIVWIASAIFYTIEYFHRVAPSVMAGDVMRSFHMNAGVMSYVSSLYFYAYALAQIPIGIMLDRYGARKLLTTAAFVISISTLLFASSESIFVFGLSRILIGFCSAFAFIGCLKLAASWFSKDDYPMIVGLTNSLGVAGGLLGQAPLAFLMGIIGWRESMVWLSVMSLITAFIIWFFVVDYPICLVTRSDSSRQTSAASLKSRQSSQKPPKLWHSLKTIASNSQMWITCLYAGLMVAPIIALAELWFVTFIEKVDHTTLIMASSINSAIFIGIACGGPLNGLMAKFLKNKKSVMVVGNIVALLTLCYPVYFAQLFPTWVLFIDLFIFGFSTSSMLLTFSFNKALFPNSWSGLVVSCTNMSIVIFGAFLQDMLGFLLTFFSVSAKNLNFSAAFDFLPIVPMIALLVLFFIRPSDAPQPSEQNE